MIRVIIYWGLYWGPPLYGDYQVLWVFGFRDRGSPWIHPGLAGPSDHLCGDSADRAHAENVGNVAA